MYLKKQKFLIVGISKSGFSATKYALSRGAECYIYEELKNPKIEASMTELTKIGAKALNPESVYQKLNDIDVLVLSPGVPINHPVAVRAKQQSKRIIGELEFGFLQFSPTVLAITGTNGKTTTATLVDVMLREGGLTTQLVGNVGVPITSVLSETDRNTVCITEVSSFQLESVNAFCPHIACITNIAPDHLERHYNMENYIFLKKRIFKNQRESEYTVLNYDDEIVRGFATETKGKVVWFSILERVDGAYRTGGKLYYKDEYIISESEMMLNGEHNVANVLLAIVYAKLMGVNTQAIVTALKTFRGVKHRVELVCEKNGVSYYNDSKSTNTASAISAIGAMKKPTVLILGGSEKGEEYYDLFSKIKESPITEVILTGASRYNMLQQAGKTGYTNLTVTANFLNAIKIASTFAKEGDNVLFSPACASFDSFSSFEERGEAFIKAVKEL